MTQATATHHQQTQDDATKTHRAEITARHDRAQVAAQLPVESDPTQIPDQQLQSRIRCEVFCREFDAQILIDASPQIRFLSSHSTWPFVFGEKGGLVASQFTETEGLFAMGNAVSQHVKLNTRPAEILPS